MGADINSQHFTTNDQAGTAGTRRGKRLLLVNRLREGNGAMIMAHTLWANYKLQTMDTLLFAESAAIVWGCIRVTDFHEAGGVR